MYKLNSGLLLFVLATLAWVTTNIVVAQEPFRPTRHQAPKLVEIRKSASEITSLIRKKDYEEAGKAITAAEESLDAYITETGAPEDHKSIAQVRAMLAQQQQLLDKRAAMAAGPGEGGANAAPAAISFAKDVAPIISENCLGCHGANGPRANLNLTNFAAWKQGGTSGPLLTIGNPNQSRIIARISAGPNQMPRNQPPLDAAEIKTIADWITQGAKYDGADESTNLTTLYKDATLPKVEVATPTGNETVSFSKDIAPFFVEMCVRCHSGATPDSNFSMETFADILRGDVLIPGKLEESRLFRLTGGLENPRMPQSQARLTRKNYEDLKKWIQEGIKYDGGDPNMKLADLAAANAPRATPFRELPIAEQQATRITRAQALWKQSLPNETPIELKTDNFFLIGNVSAARLSEIADIAAQAQKEIQSIFGVNETPYWKDRLGIIVFKDHFGYSEFNVTVQRRDIPADMYGHTRMSEDFTDAFVVMQDTGVSIPTANEPSTKFLITRLIAEAFVDRQYPGLPEWLKQGTGTVIAFRDPEMAIFKPTMYQRAQAASSLFARPSDLLRENATGPAGVALGYVMVSIMTDSPKGKAFPKFLADYSQSKNLGQAMQTNFNVTQDAFTQACWTKLKSP